MKTFNPEIHNPLEFSFDNYVHGSQGQFNFIETHCGFEIDQDEFDGIISRAINPNWKFNNCPKWSNSNKRLADRFQWIWENIEIQ